MNLKQLEVFVAVADSGSFSRGADAAFITQSTVSQHVSALEREFGVKLLDRTGRGAFPTEGGKLLLRLARQLVTDAREVRLQMDRFRGMEDVSLTIGGSNIPGNFLVPVALPRLLQKFPGLHINLVQGDSSDILARVTREEIEIGLVGTRTADERLIFVPIGRDLVRLVVPRGHPWATRRKISLEELKREGMVLRETGSGTGKTVLEALHRAGVAPRDLTVRAVLGSNEAVKHAVSAGVGISFLSTVSVKKEMERGELEPVEVEGLAMERNIYRVSRSGRELSPAAAAFAAAIGEAAGEILSPPGEVANDGDLTPP